LIIPDKDDVSHHVKAMVEAVDKRVENRDSGPVEKVIISDKIFY